MAQEIAIGIMTVIVVVLVILRTKASRRTESLLKENIRLTTELNVLKGIESGAEDKYKTMASVVFKEQNEMFKTEAATPVMNTVETLKNIIDELSLQNEKHSTEFNTHMENMSRANREMMLKTSAISDVLKNPQKRGRHVEIGLERIFEMSNLVKGIHYNTQRVTESGQRPDFVVSLSEDRVIIIDSKAPLDALLESFDADDEATKAEALDKHVSAVKNHITMLSKRKYSEKIGSALEYVVMVVPEYALLPALERNEGLVEFALNHKVILVTHSTLMVLLKTVDLMWKQGEMADRVREIGKISTDVYDRLSKFASYYANTGKGLEDAIKNYNNGVGSWTNRVLPKARELKAIGHTTKEMPKLQPIDRALRPLPEDADEGKE